MADQIVGRDRVAKEHVSLVECHRVEGVLIGGIDIDLCPGVAGLDLGAGQIVIDHAQAQPREVPHHRAAFIFAGHQYRLVDGVRAR
ncbi:hypothetical protein D3C87_1989100 [compost metagenome]